MSKNKIVNYTQNKDSAYNMKIGDLFNPKVTTKSISRMNIAS